MNRSFQLHDGKRGAALAVHVIPRAQRDEIVEIERDASIKIRLTASTSPADLNSRLVDFLAQVLGVKPEQVEIVAGHTRRRKLVSILDMDVQVAHERILRSLG